MGGTCLDKPKLYSYHKFDFVLDSADLRDINGLQSALGIGFRDISNLQLSLVHRSYLNENPDLNMTSNERLEFLGDAVLGFVVADEIYRRFPDLSEGELTKLRSALVRGETLSRIAMSMKLGEYLYLGRGEEDSGGRNRPRNLSCALEAVIGAVLVDQGLEETKDFIMRLIGGDLEQAIEDKLVADFKSRLQQTIQFERKITPVYRTIEENGPDHAKVFTVEVRAGDSILGKGTGRSKRAAEMEAAREALESLSGE